MELLDNDSIYRGLVSRINQGFCIIQMVFDENNKPVDYIFKEINPAFEANTGLKNVVNKRMKELAPEHDQHWFERYGRVALTGEEATFSAGAAALGRWYDVFAFRVGHEDQKLVAVLFSDVSERKKSEEAQKLFTENLQKLVNRHTQDLQRSNDDLLQFAHVASHDMREPLRKILMHTNLLLDTLDANDPSTESILKIRKSANRLTDILEGILKYSTVEYLSDDEIKRINLNDLIQDILTDIDELIREKGAVVEVGVLPVVNGLPLRMYQVFNNLLTNAMKFSRKDEHLKVSITSNTIVADGKSYAEISISDNGIGFEPEYADKIFKKFARLHPKDKYEGTGLGLALVKKIVEMHSGKVSSTAKPCEGATFVVTLPT